MSSITANALLKGQETQERGFVYKGMKKRGIDPLTFDAKLVKMEMRQQMAVYTLVISAIALLVVLYIQSHIKGAPFPALVVGVGTFAIASALAVLIVEGVRKRDHMTKKVDGEKVNEMLADVRKDLALRKERVQNSYIVQSALQHMGELTALQRRIEVDAEMRNVVEPDGTTPKQKTD